MKIQVDRDRCTGIGICESIFPEVFEIDDSGDLAVHEYAESPENDALFERAIDGCPTQALSRATDSD